MPEQSVELEEVILKYWPQINYRVRSARKSLKGIIHNRVNIDSGSLAGHNREISALL
jgi:hypothetical protein